MNFRRKASRGGNALTRPVGDGGRLLVTALAIGVGLFVAIWALPSDTLDRVAHFNWSWIRFVGAPALFCYVVVPLYWHARRRIALWVAILGTTLLISVLGWEFYFVWVPRGTPTPAFAGIVAVLVVMMGVVLHVAFRIEPRVKHKETSEYFRDGAAYHPFR